MHSVELYSYSYDMYKNKTFKNVTKSDNNKKKRLQTLNKKTLRKICQ